MALLDGFQRVLGGIAANGPTVRAALAGNGSRTGNNLMGWSHVARHLMGGSS